MSVYSVIEIIGTSSTSWEEAGAEKILRVSTSANFGSPRSSNRPSHRPAEGGAITYRTKLQLSEYAPEH